jgi:hypothetical protein
LNSFRVPNIHLKTDEHKLARTKISFGHKQLAGGVLRG